MIDGWHPGLGTVTIKQQDKDNDMAFTNPQAAEIAREILDEKTRGELRSTVEAAVAELTTFLMDTDCGSTLTFVKHNDQGKHYYYAAVKNGGKWYTTAQSPRVIEDDDALIEWLIGLEIYTAPQLELKATAFPESHVIEAGVVDE
jgi:hypothetical protein